VSSWCLISHLQYKLRELGYVEGQNFDMVYRYAEGFQDRLLALAQELVQLKPEVIVAAAINVAVPVRQALPRL
jgi:putative ABC transport system substrate-binding protein